MKSILSTMLVASIIFVSVSSVGAAYIETFDNGLQNWNYGYNPDYELGAINWESSGGNSGSYISGSADHLYAAWTYDTAIYGDITGETFTIDTMISDTVSGNAQFYVGRGGSYYIADSWDISLDTAWTTHQVALDSDSFTRWSSGNSESLAYVLSAPDDIGIFFGGDLSSGAGDLLIDNFGTISTAGAVPEPATLLLLGVGGFLLRKRKEV